jgi:nitrite reductase (NO-forming)
MFNIMEGYMNKAVQAVLGISLLCFGASALAATDISKLKRVTQTLVAPPAVPKHDQVAKGGPKVVQIRMETIEKEIEVAPGAKVWALTFNGTVPGPLIVVHEGDYVELTLVNPKDSTLAHNVDFHAATGALGGAGLTLVQPGEEVVLRFKAIKPGVFVYHCAPGGTMIPFHVISGMSGAIMVLPRGGLKDANGKSYTYDKAFYIGESDWYLPKDKKGNFKTYPMPAAGMADMLEVATGLVPTHIVFNGAAGSITGDNALSAKVGEKVLFIHSQANRASYPHLIGGHADLYWVGGSFGDKPLTSQETWFVPAGSAVAAAYEFKQPGLYVYLSHNLIEAVLMGAALHMNVEGKWNDDLMTQVTAPASFDASAANDH